MNETFTDTLQRISEAKRQNPDVKIVYEFPNVKSKNKLLNWLENKQNTKYRNVIDIIRVRGEK